MSGTVADLSRPPNPQIAAGATSIHTVNLVDNNGVAVPIAALITLTLTLALTSTTVIINGVNAVNILNAGRGTVTTDFNGNTVVTITLLPGDNAYMTPGQLSEKHSMVLNWTWGSPVETGRHEQVFTVVPLSGDAGI